MPQKSNAQDWDPTDEERRMSEEEEGFEDEDEFDDSEGTDEDVDEQDAE